MGFDFSQISQEHRIMKIWIFLFGIFLLTGFSMADDTNFDLIKKVQVLSDLTAEVTKHMPSILLNEPDDARIDKLAENKTHPFLIHSEGSESFVVLVNPKKKTGFLWWKTSERLVFSKERWSKLLMGEETLNPEEKLFIRSL